MRRPNDGGDLNVDIERMIGALQLAIDDILEDDKTYEQDGMPAIGQIWLGGER